MFTFLFYFKNNFTYLVSMIDVFYKDFRFYIALLLSFLVSFFIIKSMRIGIKK